MLVNTGVSPVINLRNYTLTITPQDGYLKVDGEYKVFSDFIIPDNLIELQHKLPSQIVDKVFLKSTSRSCNPSQSILKCFVYKSSSFIDVKNDEALNSSVRDATPLLLETNFLINRRMLQNLLNHGDRKDQKIKYLGNQLSNNNFSRHLSLNSYHRLNDLNFDRTAGNWSVNLVKSVIFDSAGTREDKYHKVGIYLSRLQEIFAGKPILSIWELPDKFNEKSDLKIKTLSGKILLKDRENRYKYVDLRQLSWQANKDKEFLNELSQGINGALISHLDNFSEGEINIVFSISKNDWTNIIQLKANLIDSEKELDELERLIYINPYDSELKDLKLDHTWIVEKI